MFCPRCSSQNRLEQKFCRSCGLSLSSVRLAVEGIGVLLISSEHEEIMELAHRAYLVSEGRTFGEIIPEETSDESVLHRLFNVPPIEEPAA